MKRSLFGGQYHLPTPFVFSPGRREIGRSFRRRRRRRCRTSSGTSVNLTPSRIELTFSSTVTVLGLSILLAAIKLHALKFTRGFRRVRRAHAVTTRNGRDLHSFPECLSLPTFSRGCAGFRNADGFVLNRPRNH